MKKILIAGAVTAATITAIPIVSSFAATSSVVDHINIVLQDTCAFQRTLGEGDYSATINPGTYSVNFASSTFTVTCNNPDRYTVTASFSDLESDEGSIIYSTKNPDGSASSWNAKLTDDTHMASNVTNGDTIMGTEGDTLSGGATATVRYSVGASTDQSGGTYTGTATYTLISGY